MYLGRKQGKKVTVLMKIANISDRNNVILALANAGYNVSLTTYQDTAIIGDYGREYFVEVANVEIIEEEEK